MSSDDLFARQPTVIQLKATTKGEAIDELVDRLAETVALNTDQRESARASIKKRESAMSTGIGCGFALPHASADFISEPVMIVGRCAKPLAFDAIDGELVDVIVLFLVPKGEFQKQLNALSNVAKLLHSPALREQVRQRWR